ncbi:MAG TPA: 2OG-Fe(II) oxygenase [Burkholderiales bacterium]|nr:2OG-Fe(II) oxygenase [Burkholderiales bacterium]
MIGTESVADALAERGWACMHEFLPDALWRALAAEVQAEHARGRLRAAGVGRGADYRLAGDVRGDRIRWLETTAVSRPLREALSRLDALRGTLNRELQLGLFEFEGHFALYPAGAGYRIHRDQHRGSRLRVVSCVLYLNAQWEAAHGGALRLYFDEAAEQAHCDVLPEGGTLVCFLSERFWHEVLPARRERLSLAGWFRRRD